MRRLRGQTPVKSTESLHTCLSDTLQPGTSARSRKSSKTMKKANEDLNLTSDVRATLWRQLDDIFSFNWQKVINEVINDCQPGVRHHHLKVCKPGGRGTQEESHPMKQTQSYSFTHTCTQTETRELRMRERYTLPVK